MLRVGLTGGIASGKSTVASMLRDLDCPVLAADALGHELLEPGQTAYAEIVREFGIDILDSYGNVDRTALGEIVFADTGRREKLNQILHPRIREIIQKWFAALDQTGGPELAVVEAALILEAGFNKELDRVVVCWCRPEQQLERLEERGLSPENARLRIAAQMPVEEKIARSHFVIWTEGDLQNHSAQLDRILSKL